MVSGNWWLEFPGFQDPKNPFHDKRVRQAISLAVDRDAINQAECGGMGVVDGNWINNDVEYGMEWPKWPRDVAKAKQLMAEAGYPNGFNVDWVTPVPNYYSRGERIVSQLQAIGIRSRLQTMERGVYLKRLQGGLQGVARRADHLQRHAHRRHLVELVRRACSSAAASTRKDCICVKDLDDQVQQVPGVVSTATSASSSPRRSSATILEELLLRAGVPPRLRQRDRPAHRGAEMAGRVPDDHHRLRLSVGGHLKAEATSSGSRRRWASSSSGARSTRIVTLFILSLTIFTVVRLTGDPVTLMAEPGAQRRGPRPRARRVGARPPVAGAVRWPS